MPSSRSPWLVGLATVVFLVVIASPRVVEAADAYSAQLQAALPWATEINLVELNKVETNLYVTVDAADWAALRQRCRETVEALEGISWDKAGDVYVRNGRHELSLCRVGRSLTAEEQALVREERLGWPVGKTRCLGPLIGSIPRSTFEPPADEPPTDEAPERRALRGALHWASWVHFTDVRSGAETVLFVRVKNEPPEALEKLCGDVLAAIAKTGWGEPGSVYVGSGECSRICREAPKTFCLGGGEGMAFLGIPDMGLWPRVEPPEDESPDRRALRAALPWASVRFINGAGRATNEPGRGTSLVVGVQDEPREALEKVCGDVLAAIAKTGWDEPGAVQVNSGYCWRLCRGEFPDSFLY